MMNEPIRVLQVFALMNRGGAETMIMNLYRNIDRTKIQFDFIVHTEEECAFDNEIKFLGGNIYRVPRYIGKNHFQYKKIWNKFFSEHREYKIIYGHVISTASIYLKIAKKYGLITIAHSHNTSSGYGFSAIVKNILQYPIRDIADYLFACSKSAGEWLFGKNACKSDNFFVIKNAIDTNKFIYDEKVRAKKRLELKSEEKFIIGHIGNFLISKNHEFLIDVFKIVHDEYEDAILLLIGDGELKNFIELKVSNYGLKDCVLFAGSRSDIPELLQAMDVFLFPSLFEGLPVSLIEAQAAGLPCVISDKITDEVMITKNLVSFISLNEPEKTWAGKVFEYNQSFDRKDMYDEIVESGYDIKTTSKWMQDFFLKMK